MIQIYLKCLVFSTDELAIFVVICNYSSNCNKWFISYFLSDLLAHLELCLLLPSNRRKEMHTCFFKHLLKAYWQSNQYKECKRMLRQGLYILPPN